MVAPWYWMQHASQCIGSLDVLDLLRNFLGTAAKPGRAYCNWFQVIKRIIRASLPQRYESGRDFQDVDDWANRLRSESLNPVFAVCYFHLGTRLQDFWELDTFDINSRNKNRETLLYIATHAGNERIVKCLLENGADVNILSKSVRYSCGLSPLEEAIKHEHACITVMLLDYGAGIGSSSDGSRTNRRGTSLPYGACSDQAVINLPFEHLQTSGLIFLSCTARAVEAGHSCLKRWGYDFCDEIAWFKVGHLHRLISAGRTGHWLNHTMEHCLVGSKGDTKWFRRELDVDMIVSQPRATSHEPDELYDTIDRLVGPHTRKLQVFGREDNLRPGWITIGNQLPPTYIHDPLLKSALQEFARNTSHHNLSFQYPKDWDPWEGGYDRFGYGEERDWREERRVIRKKRTKRSGRGGHVYKPPPDRRLTLEHDGIREIWKLVYLLFFADLLYLSATKGSEFLHQQQLVKKWANPGPEDVCQELCERANRLAAEGRRALQTAQRLAAEGQRAFQSAQGPVTREVEIGGAAARNEVAVRRRHNGHRE